MNSINTLLDRMQLLNVKAGGTELPVQLKESNTCPSNFPLHFNRHFIKPFKSWVGHNKQAVLCFHVLLLMLIFLGCMRCCTETAERSLMDHPPSHLPQTVTPLSSAYCPRFPCNQVAVVLPCVVLAVITFHRFQVLWTVSGQRGSVGNTAVGRDRKAWSIVTFFVASV